MARGDGPRVAVLDYGIGNLGSAQKALCRVGADARLTADPATIASADAVVLPGVGAFGACMDAIEACGLDTVARTAATDGRPFLGICIGMQMLFDGSDETPGRAGLGVLAGRVRRMGPGVKLPQMQWNRLDVTRTAPPLDGLDGAWVYFVHSYAVVPKDPAVIAATCDYGGPVAAAVADGAVFATQFHPEKSGAPGLALLRNFVDGAAARGGQGA